MAETVTEVWAMRCTECDMDVLELVPLRAGGWACRFCRRGLEPRCGDCDGDGEGLPLIWDEGWWCDDCLDGRGQTVAYARDHR
jgi:hypothetical protein